MRRCRYCKEYVIPKDAPKTDAFCSHEHKVAYAMDVVNRSRQKQAKLVKREDTRRKKEFYESSHSYQFDLTKKAAQKLANRLDAELPCICCDTPRGSAQFCGGHAKTVGAHPYLALNLLNIHGQRNALCNQHKSGNWSGDKHSKGYKQGLLDRYGQWIVDYLESYRPPKKLTCEELIDMRKEYNAEIRRLEKGLPPSRNWREIPQAEQMRGAA